MPVPPSQRVPWDVVGVGANSIDYVYRLPAVPEPHGPHAKMRVLGHHLSCGGQTATALATCASLGLRAKYVGTTGHDSNGARIRDELTRRGVDVAAVVVREAANPFAVILIDDRTGERMVLWDRDERLTLGPQDLPDELFGSARLVHVDDVDQEAAIRAATLARAAGVPVTSDIDRMTPHTETLVAAVTIPMFAEHVPPALTGEADLERALRKLRRNHSGMLCVTLGAHGAMLLAGDRLIREPAFPVAAVDTTGAGDVFRGAFIVALLRGEAPDRILRFANAAAAISCTRLGAFNGVPTLEEMREIVE